MQINDVKNIYLINHNKNNKLFVFSEINKDDRLRYNYYILSIKKERKPIIIETNNILNFLKDNKTKMIPISKNDNIYPIFEAAFYDAKKLKITNINPIVLSTKWKKETNNAHKIKKD